MYYSLICYDHEDSIDKRKSVRNKHINYLNKYKDRILFAGPIMDENKTIIGSLIIIKFSTKKEVEIFSKNDPYSVSGLFQKVSIHLFKRVF